MSSDSKYLKPLVKTKQKFWKYNQARTKIVWIKDLDGREYDGSELDTDFLRNIVALIEGLLIYLGLWEIETYDVRWVLAQAWRVYGQGVVSQTLGGGTGDTVTGVPANAFTYLILIPLMGNWEYDEKSRFFSFK